jgi:hypothetical protein
VGLLAAWVREAWGFLRGNLSPHPSGL